MLSPDNLVSTAGPAENSSHAKHEFKPTQTRRILCVFQPHTHNRTVTLYDGFLGAFHDSDLVILPNVYDARPKAGEQKVDVDAFVKDVSRESHVRAVNAHSLEETLSLLRGGTAKRGDVVVTMGAGDVWKIADGLLA